MIDTNLLLIFFIILLILVITLLLLYIRRKDDSRALLRVKQTAPTVFCSFAVWRFLSFVNNSPVFAHFRFLWQG